MNIEFGIISLVILIFSAILHEVMHGLVADRLGDPTARLLGRLTLNPIPHIDLYMSILLPLMLFFFHSPILIGGAKPVPVDPFNLRDGRRDMAIVSLAGPLTNFLIAAIFTLLVHVLYPGMQSQQIIQTNILGLVLGMVINLNLLLGIFNLLPIPPLDGSKVFALLLPEREAMSFVSMGSMGLILVFGFLFLFGGILSTLLNFALQLLGF